MPDLLSFLKECEELETRVGRLYAALAARFADHGRVAALFRELAAEEVTHARTFRLLQSLGAQAAGSGAVDPEFAARRGALGEQLDQALAAVELGRPISPESAVSLALRIEASSLEANVGAAVKSEDPGFRQLVDSLLSGDRKHERQLRELQRSLGKGAGAAAA
ncbi:MAG: hypothetical protein ACYDA8_21605 [Deferrisomatales bacterium]